MGLEQKKIIVCGIGNLLLQDEGVGVHVVRELKSLDLPPSVEILEAGVSLLDFLSDLQKADRLILIDAMKADGPPGSIYLLDARELTQRPANHPLSLHQVGALDILRIMALEGDPPPCLVIGIEPASLDWGLEPSPLIKAQMPEILRAVKEQIERLLPQGGTDSD